MYEHGSDLLAGRFINDTFVGFGHSRSCTISDSAETKERMTKEISQTGKWSEKVVSRLRTSISTEGFKFYGDSLGYEQLKAAMYAAEPIVLRYCRRGEESIKYWQGNFVITSLELNAPADDDASYSATFENSGEVTAVGLEGAGNVSITPGSLLFPTAGGTMIARLIAPGPVTISVTGTGLSATESNGIITVVATAYTGTSSDRTGTVTAALVADPTKKAVLAVTTIKAEA